MLRPIVVCGPSGTGKSTLLRRLFDLNPGRFSFSVSHTTRAPRTGEIAGEAYHFVNPAEFDRMVSAGEFIEHAQFSGNKYGTSFGAVSACKAQCILDIDAQGVRLVKASPVLDPIYLFIAPPSLQILRERLVGRNTESVDALEARLAAAKGEIAYAQTGAFDYVIVNDDVERATSLLQSAIDGKIGSGDQLPSYDSGLSAVGSVGARATSSN